ncbi:MAG: ABC transporter permease [Eubacteriales bacterium]|nr:ABC transporter permease [Eubacteriales bacterium]
MFAIYKKELKIYFSTAIGYVFLGIYMLLAGLLYALINLASLSGDIPSFLGQFSIIQLFLIPMLSMGFFAKEYNEGTSKLLFSAPIKSSDIVLGKFLAGLTMIILSCTFSLVFIIITAIYGEVYIAETLLAYCGFFLLSVFILSIDTFLSSFAVNQITAIIISFAINLMLWLIDLINIDTTTIAGKILAFISPYKRVSSFMLGQLSIANLLYFLLFSYIFLWACVLNINTHIYGGVIDENK